MSLIDWLKRQSEYPRFYWSSRDSSRVLAGVGVREESCEPIPGSLGLLRFDDHRPTDALWAPFGTSRFVVPRVLHADSKPSPLTPLPLGEGNFALAKLGEGSRKIWVNTIQKALAHIQQGHLQKVVLARQITLQASKPIDPIALLEKLQVQMPTAYHFLWEPEPGIALIGASPEKLYQRKGNYIESEAQAGTKLRNAHPDELLKNKKELHEHQIVVDNLLQAFEQLCLDYGITQAQEIVQLPQVQHIRTRLAGILRPDIHDADILKTLHPTAAVCGWPRPEAFELIRDLENFDRGFYAGALGYLTEQESEFAVAIRCAIVKDSCIHLFGGAGLVQGSVDENEWQEIENKIGFWRSIL